MSCFICQTFSENSPSNPQLAQECPATPLSSLHSLHHLPTLRLLFIFSSFLLIRFFLSLSAVLLSPRCLAFLSLPLITSLSVCLLVLSGDGSWGRGCSGGRRVGGCQSSQTARCKHKRVAVEIGSHMAKLDLLTLSPLLAFIISLSVSASCAS